VVCRALKNFKKKLASPWPLPLHGKVDATNSLVWPFKKSLKKVKKKLVRALEI